MSNNILSFAAYIQSTANPATSQLKKQSFYWFSVEILLEFGGGDYAALQNYVMLQKVILKIKPRNGEM